MSKCQMGLLNRHGGPQPQSAARRITTGIIELNLKLTRRFQFRQPILPKGGAKGQSGRGAKGRTKSLHQPRSLQFHCRWYLGRMLIRRNSSTESSTTFADSASFEPTSRYDPQERKSEVRSQERHAAHRDSGDKETQNADNRRPASFSDL